MKKGYVVDTFKKYHLGGLTEKVKIVVKDKVLTTQFIAVKKNLVGTIIAPEFELNNCQIGIYDTSQLLKLVGITDSFLTLDVEQVGSVATKLLIADNEFNLEYSLADIMLTPTYPKIEEPEYDLEADLTVEFANKFIKSYKALTTEVFTISANKDSAGIDVLTFNLGGSEKFTNKINFTIPATKVKPGKPTLFPLEEFKEILDNNKDLSSGKLFVSFEGLIKVEFVNEEKVTASYILIGKD